MSPETGRTAYTGAVPGGAVPGGSLAVLGRWWRETVTEPVLSVLFPPRCVGCGDFESHLCPHCRSSLEPVGRDCCPRCGEPGPQPLVGGRCAHCMAVDLAFAGARSAFLHTGPARRMVVEFKSGGQPVLAPLMADLARPAFRELVSSVDKGDHVVVTWVPSHKAAQRRRGYNQAELLARALAAGPPALPRTGLVRKTLRTRHQKELDRAGRQANLHGAFVLDEKAAVSFSSALEAVVLVDDVYTTGATVQEVSSVLHAGTGAPVYVFTFSRAVSNRNEGHD